MCYINMTLYNSLIKKYVLYKINKPTKSENKNCTNIVTIEPDKIDEPQTTNPIIKPNTARSVQSGEC